jgi:hypothetical protein
MQRIIFAQLKHDMLESMNFKGSVTLEDIRMLTLRNLQMYGGLVQALLPKKGQRGLDIIRI